MSDPEDERSSQPGDLYATPVGTNEDDVATEADAVSTQISENITVRRSSGVAGPTVDSSRPSAISSLMATRGPAEEMDEHEKVCHDYKVKIDSFFGAHPLGKDYSRVFNRTCNKPMPPVPQDDVLLRFLALQSSEIDENDIRTVRAVLKSCMNEYDDLCAAMMDSVKHEKIKSRRSSVGEASKILQLDFNRDRQLQEQQNKTLNDMTSGNELIEGQFGAIVEFLKYTGRSNWYAIFEFFKSKFGVVDAKVIGGHLDYLFSVAGGANFGTELNSEDLSADQPSKYIPMSTKSNVNTKTTTSMPQGQRWSHLASDEASFVSETKAIETFIRLHELHGRYIDDDGFTVMKPPESLDFFYSVVARYRLNLWLAKHLLNRFPDLMTAMGASELEETQCKNLRLRYDAYFSGDTVAYDALPLQDKVTVMSFVANKLAPNMNIGVNLIISLANIFNPADIRENVSRLGVYLGSLSLKQSDNLQQRFIDTETERRKLAELAWPTAWNSLASIFGLSINPDTGVPKMLESSTPAMYTFLIQAYDYRGPNNGIGGISTARKALEQSIVKFCGQIHNFRQPMEDVPIDKIKSVYEDFIQAPSAHGLPIDPPNTVDRSSFTRNGSRNGSGFVGTAQL